MNINLKPSPAYKRLVKGLFRYDYPQSDQPEPFRQALVATAGLFTVPASVAYHRDALANIPIECIRPDAARDNAVLLYLHGGAYYMGSIETYRHFVARLAVVCQMHTIHIDYRLAPEHPFPAALDDATTVYRKLLEQYPPQRIFIAGDSAGGHLTLSSLLALRDAGVPLPAAAALISPWTDFTGSGASMTTHQAKDPIIDARRTAMVAGWYAANTPRDHPLLSPVFADFRGLPPMLVHVGTEEVLLDDSIRLAERARAQGVPIELEVWEGMVHVWHYYAEWIPEARDALARIAIFLTRYAAD